MNKKENEPIEYNASEKLIQCFLEDWNDRNPNEKLDPDIIDMITDYLRYSYVAGWDDLRIKIERRLNNYSGPNINKHLLLKQMHDFDRKL